MIKKFCRDTLRKVLPNSIYAALRRFYNKFFSFTLIINYIDNKANNRHNKKALLTLIELINQAHKENKKLFIQFPIIPWNRALFQRPQQFAIAMGRIGYLSIYLDLECIGIKQITENVYITSQYAILNHLSNALVSVYLNYPPNVCEEYLIPAFYARNRVFYEYVDHPDEKICGSALAKLIKKRLQKIHTLPLEGVVATAQSLYNEAKELSTGHKISYIPNGVDVEHYNKLLKNEINLKFSKKILNIQSNKKIIGYFGAIAPWIWEELLIRLADERPNYCLLMIGPMYGEVKSFPNRSNIIFTDRIEYQYLPYYAQYFDISIIPFRHGEVARSTSPLKLFEYFAIGKPIVVTSDLIECTKFEGVFSASTIEEFIKKVDEAITQTDNLNIKEKYKKYAEENSWIARAKALDEFIFTNNSLESV